jgi:hypothetical protein
MNDWTAPANAKFVYQNDGTYKVTLSLEAGDHEFKIGSKNWWDGNFGGHQDGLRIGVDEELELFRDPQSQNLHLDLSIASAEYTFIMDARNFARPLLRITRR